MKSLILLLGMLAIVTSVHCKRTVADKGEPIANKEEYVKEINDLRREYAKKSRIPNMYKLVWDDYLATQVEMGDFSCYKKTCRESRRDGDDHTEKFDQDKIKHKWGDEKRQDLMDEYKTHIMGGLEELTPGQQKIGCYHIAITDDGKKDDGTDAGYGVLKTKTRCFLAPEGLGDSWKVPRGEAGSACAEGFVNDDGLCAPKSESSGNSGSAEKDKESGSKEERNTESSGQPSKMSGVVTTLVMMVVLKFM
ncbi:hypothetical protein CAEBREN_06595 [Caenorhabditis brenneri]|uniref:Uncharacterized protein n=1 Tax=Caenorhabditis brenneri TaxID=135651 RepID=G0MR10_CAEBE|nr:hypothetical protein CAEBREN_06595 [Caenorhabditis brenneri]